MFRARRRSGRNTAPLILLFILLSGAGRIMPASAQGSRRATSAGAELLLSDDHVDQIVVTASRIALRSGEAPSAVTVLTEKDLRETGAVTLFDALRYVPGLDIFQMNRVDTAISIRGLNNLNNNKLLIMIDGRSIYEEANGGIVWSTAMLLISRIKRVEIVRGAGSALYGANAFNGVINIILKTPHELASAASKTSLRAVVGPQGTTFNELLASTPTTSGWDFTLGGAYNRTDGYGGRRAGEVRDSYTTPILTLDAQKQMKRGSLQVSLGQSSARTDYNQSGPTSLNDVHLHSGFALLRYDEQGVKDPFGIRIFGNFDLSALPATPATATAPLHVIDTTTFDIEAQRQIWISSQHNAVYGLNYRSILLRSQVTDAAGLSRKNQQELYAAYFQDDYRFARRTRLFAGLRLDQNSQYGFNFTPRLSLLHTLSSSETLRLSYGSSFRSPTLLETYEAYSTTLAPGLNLNLRGNRDLKPERVTSYEAGYRRAISGGFVALNAYYNEYSDLIGYQTTATAPPPYPAGIPTEIKAYNQGRARGFGLEAEAQFRLARNARGLFNYAYQDVANDNGSPAGISPRHKINLGADFRLSSQWNAFLGAHYVDAISVQSGTDILTLPSYIRADLRVAYRWGAKGHPLSLSLIVQDLFDSNHLEYPDLSGGAPGPLVAPQRRTAFLMFEGKF